jgi:hypothetical protein
LQLSEVQKQFTASTASIWNGCAQTSELATIEFVFCSKLFRIWTKIFEKSALGSLFFAGTLELPLKLSAEVFILLFSPFQNLFSEYEITQMTYMRDAEVFYRQLEAEILEEVNRREIVTRSYHGHTLYDPQEIIDANEGQVPLSLDEFYSVIPTLDVPALPAPTVTAEMFKSCSVRVEQNHQAIYGVPTMASLGLECPRAHTRWPGGETVALERLKYKMKQNTLYEFNQGPSTSKANDHEYERPGTSEPWFETQPETTGLR